MRSSASDSEIEAKFAVSGLDPIRRRLLQLAARPARPRLQETNLRFDMPDGRLQQSRRVLRLRKNHDTRLTFKAPGPDIEQRQELEVAVDQADVMQRLLEGLGFEVFFVYEKYRETFTLDGAEVMLDELPFGVFVEIEADDLARVHRTAERLGLAWEERLPLSYLALFDRLRQRKAWTFRDATFANFSEIPPLSPEDLKAEAAVP
jgi:adenylate cyclase class 2